MLFIIYLIVCIVSYLYQGGMCNSSSFFQTLTVFIFLVFRNVMQFSFIICQFRVNIIQLCLQIIYFFVSVTIVVRSQACHNIFWIFGTKLFKKLSKLYSFTFLKFQFFLDGVFSVRKLLDVFFVAFYILQMLTMVFILFLSRLMKT